MCCYGLHVSKGMDAAGGDYALLLCHGKFVEREHIVAGTVAWNWHRSIFLCGGGYDQGTDWKGRWNFAGNTGNGMDALERRAVCGMQLFVFLCGSSFFSDHMAQRERDENADGPIYVDGVYYGAVLINGMDTITYKDSNRVEIKTMRNKRNTRRIIMNRYMWDGSYTVEAAFIVPVVLGIFYGWMFQLFYLHDQVVMDGMLQEMVVLRQEKKECGQQEMDEWREKLQEALWIAKVDGFQLQKNSVCTKGKINASAVWKIPVMQPFLGNCFRSSVSQTISCVQPETALRIKGKEEETSGGD